jgi:prolipoprotein diacylglyceryl transferase
MTNFLTVTWDVNPVMFHIGSFNVMWYGLSWMLAILIGKLFFDNFTKREGLNPAISESVFWWGTLATIIGARLGHVFFYEPMDYLQHPLQILNIRQGGMASHGAAVGMLVGFWCFARRNKLPYIWGMDRLTIPVTVGGAIVRIGNLMNSEIYGRSTDLPWGFEFVRDPRWSQALDMGGSGSLPVHPTQIYEALCYLFTFVVLVLLYYRWNMAHKRPGLLFGVGLIGIFVSRFFIEFIKNPQVAREIGMTLDIGQWLSIPFILVGILMIVWPFTKYRLVSDPHRWGGLNKYNPSKAKKTTNKNKKR